MPCHRPLWGAYSPPPLIIIIIIITSSLVKRLDRT